MRNLHFAFKYRPLLVGIERWVCWSLTWFIAVPVYSATFCDLSSTVSSALIKSLYSMSSLFNSFSESSKKQFPVHSALTFFCSLFIPWRLNNTFRSWRIVNCCFVHSVFFVQIFSLASDEPFIFIFFTHEFWVFNVNHLGLQLTICIPQMVIQMVIPFPGGSAGKESACNAGDLG